MLRVVLIEVILDILDGDAMELGEKSDHVGSVQRRRFGWTGQVNLDAVAGAENGDF